MSSNPSPRHEDQSAGARSRIKPHLLAVTSSGTWLDGVVIERDRERARTDIDTAQLVAPSNVVVVHTGRPAKLSWRIDGGREGQVFTDGDAVLNPMGLTASPRWNSDVELLLVAISQEVVTRTAAGMGKNGATELVPAFGFRDELVKALAHTLVREFNGPSLPDRLYVDSLVSALVAHLVRNYSSGRPPQRPTEHGLPHQRLANATDFIRSHLPDALTVEQMAAAADLSPSQFSRMFKRSMGVTPYRYVIERRLELAQRLLGQTDLSIAEIAARCGFADQSHLTRALRQRTGMTPRMFRTF
jgi:AraC family transcriptional regulator